jgi:hypothetical protein
VRTVLICHEEAQLHREGLARWLASFSTLAGIVVLQDDAHAQWRRMRREIRRSGWIGFADVAAYRAYHRLIHARADRTWEARALENLESRFAPVPREMAILRERSPNSPSVERFIRQCAPDVMLALCKHLLAERIFSVPRQGTLVIHPGICPQYRNAHGAFWALANDDVGNVGVTLLRIDRGIDTGPVFAYFRSSYDEMKESHVVIQHRGIIDNLDAIRDRLRDIVSGNAQPINTEGLPSAIWGQPRLTSYARWRRHARRRQRARNSARVS